MKQKYNNTFMVSKRLLGDPEADLFIAESFGDATRKAVLQNALKDIVNNDSLLSFKKLYPDYDFIARSDQLPGWAVPRKMKAGAIFFSRHSETIMNLLGLMSLPYCYNAANGAMVLYLSEMIRNDTTKRLFETALFVWDVMAPNAFVNGGKGFSEILKVRIMHAAVRFYTFKSGKWDDAWGIPVNQEDMAGTNLSFSLIVIRGLRLLGFSVSKDEMEAFLHLWNVIGSLTGLSEDLVPESPKMAQQLDRIISERQFTPSAQGRELTHSLTRHILSVNKTKATDNDIIGLMRYLLGKDVADQLGIMAPDLPTYKVSLIRTINLLKSFVPKGDPNDAYHRAYRSFLANANVDVKQK
ncbi:oxygenase MpaB family protein [Mucilaginibacter sp. 44-25]|uniref:oxygenase MpaB family protein n=1 Tax=Mucilaginibacter sp. 44-25 TaxID=1895794 RepID=UPI000966ED85|nr:oxygenase MpaB family protein [Mucilaginibacter sp. 44-25]OJW13215.1 MAG: hypothetical protein BGO48_00160 [Mucilaginibacter sp. 44-25]